MGRDELKRETHKLGGGYIACRCHLCSWDVDASRRAKRAARHRLKQRLPQEAFAEMTC